MHPRRLSPGRPWNCDRSFRRHLEPTPLRPPQSGADADNAAPAPGNCLRQEWPRACWLSTLTSPCCFVERLQEIYMTLDARSEEHTSELQSRGHLVCRLLLEKKNKNDK